MLLAALLTWFLWVLPNAEVIGRTAPISRPVDGSITLHLSDASNTGFIHVRIDGDPRAATTTLKFSVRKTSGTAEILATILSSTSSEVAVESCEASSEPMSTGVSKLSDLPELQALSYSASQDPKDRYSRELDDEREVQLTTFTTEVSRLSESIECTLTGTWRNDIPGYTTWSVPRIAVAAPQGEPGYWSPNITFFHVLPFGTTTSIQNSTPNPDKLDSSRAIWHDFSEGREMSAESDPPENGVWAIPRTSVSASLLDSEEDTRAEARLFYGGIALGFVASIVVWLLAELFEFFGRPNTVFVAAPLPKIGTGPARKPPALLWRAFMGAAVAVSMAMRAIRRR
jgi:hypothetical protein